MIPLNTRNVPTGPGSRGGHWHEREFRATYHRAYRAGHPEYRDRERLRRGRARHGPDWLPPGPLPMRVSGINCACHCGCGIELERLTCGMCATGTHAERIA